MISVVVGAATSAGRVRTLNEDNYLARYPVFLVADGMGGHAAGEVASALVVKQFSDLVDAEAVRPGDVAKALGEVNAQILFKSEQSSDRSGMGTTATGLVAVEAGGLDHWLVFNVGDSRVYRFGSGKLEQLSTDHSEVQELILAGEISAERARTHPRRNVVTRSLGTRPAPAADQWLVPPTLGERFLLCSDGLTGELTDEMLVEELRGGSPVQEVADGLVARAVGAGGRDNVTVVIVEVVGTTDDASDLDTVPRGAA